MALFEIKVNHTIPTTRDVILFGTSLQGITWILRFLPGYSGAFDGLGHLWFITIIMLCYLLLIGIKLNEKHSIKINKITLFIILTVMTVLLGLIKVNISYFLCFIIGYEIGKRQYIVTKKGYTLSTLGMILAVIFRLVMRQLFDGTALYDIVVFNLTHIVLALWIFFTIEIMTARFRWVTRIAGRSYIQIADTTSFYIYITHEYFLSDHFEINKITDSIVIQLLLFIILTVITAIALKEISGMFIKKRASLQNPV